LYAGETKRYKMTFADRVLQFYQNLHIDKPLPKGITLLNPYQDSNTWALCRQFYEKYYGDEAPRLLMLGINPGRFGSGTTGISFTDPVKLQAFCGIENNLPKRTELSSDFIYKVVEACGGPSHFFRKVFISAVSPLGFTANGKNLNYYDDPDLERAILPFVEKSIQELVSWPLSRDRCFCIGEGKNFNFLSRLNKEHQWFGEIVPLAHPRFIMQYKRKSLATYVDEYATKLAI
jgi:hypothetical protein